MMSLENRFTSHFCGTALTLAILALPATALAASPTSAGHDHAGAPAKLSLDAGRKWPTDAPLRQAMANIRKVMDASLHAIHEGKLATAEYVVLAGKIQGEAALFQSLWQDRVRTLVV
ncbi:MAG: hypothetical protein ABI790_13965, partial [Betaproteobacteria bacterium]